MPEDRGDYAGLLVTLARQENPDTSEYNDPEVVWRLGKDHHAGLIVKSESLKRVEDLLSTYSERMTRDILASAPPRDKPTF
jgi:uncharacterized protein YqiB (DUF1249 family)